MGGVGGRSLEQLKEQADRLAGASLFEDDQILRQVTANMLTFGNVSGAAFDRAQQAAVDLSARLGQDLQASTIMIGKALNDPIKGLSALRRVGIQFTADQEAQIKAMAGVGDMAGAQAIMLAELERQFGGSAEAARNAANPMERMRLSFAAMAGEIGEVLLPVADRLATAFSNLTERFGKMSPAARGFAVAAAAVAAAIGPVMVAVGALVAGVGSVVSAFGAGGALAGLLPLLGPVALAVGAVVLAFVAFKDEIVPALQSFGAALQEHVGPKIGPMFEALRGAVSAVGEVFAAIFGGGNPASATANLQTFGRIVAQVFGAAVDLITGAINTVTSILRALAALLRGDFSAMWGYLGQAVMSLVRGILNAFETLFPGVIGWVQRTFEGVKHWLLDRFAAVVRGIGEKVQQVEGFFRGLWDAVVGHSWIPDMVEAIGDWMGPRLQSAMVDPAEAATAQTADAFAGLSHDVSSQMDSLFRSITSKDWRGALGSIFEMMGGSSGKLGAFGKIGSAILGALPAFANGGSFRVGGTGGIDSQVRMIRATPNERVTVTKPGQFPNGPRPMVFDMRGAVVTADLLAQVNQRVASGEARAVRTATEVARRSAPGLQNRLRALGTT